MPMFHVYTIAPSCGCKYALQVKNSGRRSDKFFCSAAVLRKWTIVCCVNGISWGNSFGWGYSDRPTHFPVIIEPAEASFCIGLGKPW